MSLELKQHISIFLQTFLLYQDLILLISGFDIAYLSETYLNSKIPRYSRVREDQPSISNHGGICVYYKSSLPFRLINVKYLQESI